MQLQSSRNYFADFLVNQSCYKNTLLVCNSGNSDFSQLIPLVDLNTYFGTFLFLSSSFWQTWKEKPNAFLLNELVLRSLATGRTRTWRVHLKNFKSSYKNGWDAATKFCSVLEWFRIIFFEFFQSTTAIPKNFWLT